MARWIMLVALVACDSGKRAAPPLPAPRDAVIAVRPPDAAVDAVPVDLSLEPGAAPTCPPADHDSLVTCLMERSPCPQRNEILPQRRPDLELVRTTWSGCGETYVIAKHADRWYAIQELFYEQSHGRRDGVLHVHRVRDVRVKDHRVTQIDYSTDEDISTIDDSAPDGIRNSHTHSDDRLACTWPADGAPTCAPAPR
jgi:hypothetical protein